jgi:hypothetical protein
MGSHLFHAAGASIREQIEFFFQLKDATSLVHQITNLPEGRINRGGLLDRRWRGYAGLSASDH